MAIQNRRGNYEDFNPSKLLPGEFALSLDDPKLFMGLGGGNNKQIPFLDDADKRYVLVNQGTQNAGKILEVALDGTLKLIPKPASGGSENILDITFATLGFDSGAGLDKESDAYVEPPRTIFNQVYNHNGAIRLTFSNGDTIVLAKSIEKTKDNPNYWTAEWYAVVQNYIQGNPNYVFYKLIFRKLDYMARWYRFDMNTGGSGSGSGGNYKLPIATSQTLGGVKVNPKTINDTVEVSADANGKLFVPKYPTPSGGGGTTNYTDLNNKPKINGVELNGDKKPSDFQIATTADLNKYVPKNQGSENVGKILEVGSDGNLKLGTKPTGGGGTSESDLLDIDFASLGFSGQGLDSGSGASTRVPYDIWHKAQSHKGPICVNFTDGRILTMYKGIEKSGGDHYWYALIKTKIDGIVKFTYYELNFRNRTMGDWNRTVINNV